MDRNFAEALKLVLKHEGGWSDHKDDPGGATMKGVTLATYRRYIKTTGTKEDLRKITDLQLRQVYRQHYWDAVKGDELPDGVDYAVMDYGVNSGPGRAIKDLQRVLDVAADGVIGPQTLAAARMLPADQIINALCNRRMKFLQGLKTWKTFGKGWKSRVDGVRAEALKMAAGTVAGIPTAPTKPVVEFQQWRPGPPPDATPPSPPAATPEQLVGKSHQSPAPDDPRNSRGSFGWLSLILSLFKPKGA